MKLQLIAAAAILVSVACIPVKQQTTGVDKEKMLKLVNEVRKKGCNCGGKTYASAPALTWNTVLENAATAHSADMFKRQKLDHNSADGTTAGKRIQDAGYSWKAYGENVAAGYKDEDAVVKGWLSSTQHCRNIMDPDFREMGAGRMGDFWTQDFGAH